MACDEMQKNVILAIDLTYDMKKNLKNVKCEVNVSMKIKKPNLLHDWSHGVDLTMCK